MSEGTPAVQQIPCLIRHLCFTPPSVPCARCQKPAPPVWTVTRTAIDIDLDHPVLLAVEVSVHHCAACRHYFRAQPPFLRPDAIYTNRVVQKAIEAVYHDGMAIRRVASRLARDFWVRPSAKMIRMWCQTYARGCDFDRDYLPWVVETFSGVLCVDELYQDQIALLLAVDPAAPEGDRLVGYQLVDGTVDQAAVTAFLTHLKEVGIDPDEVITDGAAIYPQVLAEVWPKAAHQLCLFHETRRVTNAVLDVVKAVRKELPTPPSPARLRLGGRRRQIEPPAETTDVATERWRWRTAQREMAFARVHDLREKGVSIRAIARSVGLNRRTVIAWLKQEKPDSEVPPKLVEAPVPVPETTMPPPTPWKNWEEVRSIQENLRKDRFLLVRRREHLNTGEEDRLQALLESPIGADLRVARHFLTDWYAIWRDETGERRAAAEARENYETWQTNPEYRRLAPLRRVQQGVDLARFERLSQFLRDSLWEATNNGAERMGRTFRHRQRPHFNLRTTTAIDEALKVRACLHKEAVTSAHPALGNRSPRGRPSQHDHGGTPLPIAA